MAQIWAKVAPVLPPNCQGVCKNWRDAYDERVSRLSVQLPVSIVRLRLELRTRAPNMPGLRHLCIRGGTDADVGAVLEMVAEEPHLSKVTTLSIKTEHGCNEWDQDGPLCAALGRLSALRELDLVLNMTGVSPALARALRPLRLRRLLLHMPPRIQMMPYNLAEVLTGQRGLERLDLQCELNADELRAIGSLGPTLRELRLDQNITTSLTRKAAFLIPTLLRLTNLTNLSFGVPDYDILRSYGTPLDDPSGVVAAIASLSRLEALSLNVQPAESLRPDALDSLRGLTSLKLGYHMTTIRPRLPGCDLRRLD